MPRHEALEVDDDGEGPLEGAVPVDGDVDRDADETLDGAEDVADDRLSRPEDLPHVRLSRDVRPLGRCERERDTDHAPFVDPAQGAKVLLVGLEEELHLSPADGAGLGDLVRPAERGEGPGPGREEVLDPAGRLAGVDPLLLAEARHGRLLRAPVEREEEVGGPRREDEDEGGEPAPPHGQVSPGGPAFGAAPRNASLFAGESAGRDPTGLRDVTGGILFHRRAGPSSPAPRFRSARRRTPPRPAPRRHLAD